jgi:hypothetical protein
MSSGDTFRFVAEGWGLVVGVCARAPGLTSVRDPAVRRVGDVMFDGVIPLGEACCGRSIFLGRPPGRWCRQQGFWSRPHRICVSGDSARTEQELVQAGWSASSPSSRSVW